MSQIKQAHHMVGIKALNPTYIPPCLSPFLCELTYYFIYNCILLRE